MAVAEGILIVAVTAILSGLLPTGMIAGMTAPSLQSPREQLRSPLPPAVRPKPARPGIMLESELAK